MKRIETNGKILYSENIILYEPFKIIFFFLEKINQSNQSFLQIFFFLDIPRNYLQTSSSLLLHAGKKKTNRELNARKKSQGDACTVHTCTFSHSHHSETYRNKERKKKFVYCNLFNSFFFSLFAQNNESNFLSNIHPKYTRKRNNNAPTYSLTCTITPTHLQCHLYILYNFFFIFRK